MLKFNRNATKRSALKIISRVQHRRHTIKIFFVTDSRKVDSLHVETAGLQTVPECGGCHTPLVISLVCQDPTVTILEYQSIEDMISSLFIFLNGMSFRRLDINE